MELRSNNHLIVVLITSAWIIFALTVIGILVTIGYLKSKPPLCQTIMDYVNIICFTSFIPSSLFFALGLTINNIFEDSGEIIASILAVSMPASTTNLQLQLTFSFIVQSLLVVNPSYLDGQYFQNIVLATTMVIPVASFILYTYLFIQGGTSFVYVLLRGNIAPDRVIALMITTIRVLISITMFAVCAVTRFLLKLWYDSFEEENSVVNSKVTLAVTLVHCLLPILSAAFYPILKELRTYIRLFAPMIGILSHFIIILVVDFTNTHVQTYARRLYTSTLLSSLRYFRPRTRIDCIIDSELSMVARENSESS